MSRYLPYVVCQGDHVNKVDAVKILLNAPDRASEEAPPERRPTTGIELVDDGGRPLVGQRFVIELSDGSERIGVTDAQGCAELDLKPGGATVRFPDLADVASA